MNNKRSRYFIFIACFVMAASSLPAAQDRVTLAGQVPKLVQKARMMGRAAATEPVELSLMINIDENLLQQTLNDIYGAGASAQRHYLSSTEFAQKFGLTDKRQILKEFARANGLAVIDKDDRPESLVVRVSGNVGAIERAFSAHMNHYQSADGRLFRSLDADPSIPAVIAPHLKAVFGLSDLTHVQHPHARLLPASHASVPAALSGTGPGGTLSPSDIKQIYDLNLVPLTGTGQTVALFELDGYSPSDIAAYETQFSLPNTPVTFRSVDSVSNLCGVDQNKACNGSTFNTDGGMLEVALDIDMVLALSPGITALLVYEGPNSNQGIIDIDDAIADDNMAQVVSTSWGEDEQDSDPSVISAESVIFRRMAIQGQSMFSAAGDCGAYDQQDTNGNCITTNGFRVDDPASQPYVTGVGGTGLFGTLGSFTEKTWNDLNSGNGATGGGVSVVWTIPSYQVGISGAASQTFRNVPDVALNSDPFSGYAVYAGGKGPSSPGFGAVGGTSAAAPLWAAMTALINQERASVGQPVVGFANSVIYSLASSTSSTTAFNDITSGNNGLGSAGFSAGAGYDNVTGWGSFNGSGILAAAIGVKSVVPQQASSLSSVYAFPNPWDVRKTTKSSVTIANLPDGATVKIFTISGYWVKTLPTALGGSAAWDLKNDSGEKVASGLYFYQVTSSVGNSRGEIAIIK